MPATTATITGNITDAAGDAFAGTNGRVKVWLESSDPTSEGTVAGGIRLNAVYPITVDEIGDITPVEVPVTVDGAPLYRLHIEGHSGGQVRKPVLGYFDVTGDDDLENIRGRVFTPTALTPQVAADIAGALDAATAAQEAQAAAEAARDQAVDISGLDTTDAAVAAGFQIPGSESGAYLSTTIEAGADERIDVALNDGAIASGKAARPGNWTVFLGDSITFRGAQTPDTGWRGTGFVTYGSILSGQRIRYVRNAGIGGNTTAQMLARFDTDVTPYAPNNVVIMGGTNDTGGSVALGTIQTNIRALVAKVRAIGATPILCTIPPNSTASPADRKARISALNTWLRRYTAQQGIPLVDFYSLLVDPANGNWLAAYNSDGTHPNNAADYAMGKLLADTIAPLLPSYFPGLPADANDPHNFIRNALFLTDTDANGVPDNWSNQAGVTGQTPSIISGDTSIKGNWFKFTAAASSGTSILFQSQTTSQGGAPVVPGNRYLLIGRIKGAAQSAGQQVNVQIRFTGGVTTDARAVDRLDQPITPGGIFHVEWVAPAGTTTVQAQIQLTAGTGDVQVAQVGIYDLTAMGSLN